MLNALDRMVPPRSPQDEDHEADKTIGAAACDAHKVRIGRALTSDEVMAVMTGVQTALSRVSPSRDGSVAVEDVERLKNELQTLVDWFNDAPFLRAERLLYDLSRSSTDRPEQPEPDVPGGQPPAEPDDH